MKKLLNRKGTAGFSLVELMVVVAIIGILASIAIPNYQTFQRKARTSEAKSTLGAIATTEYSFFAEWSTYYGDLADLGFGPNGDIGYNTGWSAPIVPLITGYAPNAADYADTIAYCAGTMLCNAKASASMAGGLGAGAASNNMFSVESRADLGGASNDAWTINEAKTLSQTSNGTI